jgi:RAQPRD family integrative conjugative element protein
MAMQTDFQKCAAVAGLLAAVLGATPVAAADEALERSELAAALRQLEAFERLIRQGEAAQAGDTRASRYHFDYARLSADLARIRAGIEGYLTPERAQPRDPAELLSHYRQSSPEATR